MRDCGRSALMKIFPRISHHGFPSNHFAIRLKIKQKSGKKIATVWVRVWRSMSVALPLFSAIRLFCSILSGDGGHSNGTSASKIIMGIRRSEPKSMWHARFEEFPLFDGRRNETTAAGGYDGRALLSVPNQIYFSLFLRNNNNNNNYFT